MQNQLKANNLSADVEELFPGYFKNTRVYRVKYKLLSRQYLIDDDANDLYQIYCQGSVKGQAINISNPQDFNANFTCNPEREVSNLDKVYLYLFARGLKPAELASPKGFRRRIKEKSQFANRYADIFKSNCGTCSLGTNSVPKQFIEDCMEQSGERKLVTFSFYNGPRRAETHEFTFKFDKRGQLLNVDEALVAWAGKE